MDWVFLRRNSLLKMLVIKASSSIGRVSVSKTEGWGFDALLTCHIFIRETANAKNAVIEIMNLEI